MKVRSGFVANSSSSSFICDTCQEEFQGWDICPSDVDHHHCEHYHTICDESVPSECFDDPEFDYEIPEKYCPCCKFEIVAECDMVSYLKRKYNVNPDDVFAIIKEQNKRRRKLYDHEYITHVLTEVGSNTQEESEAMRNEFKTYQEFLDWKR